MGNTDNYNEEISLQDILGILGKNRYFIIMFIIAGLLIGLLISYYQILQNPVEYYYTGKVTLELSNSFQRTNQPQTLLHVVKSTTVLKDSMDEVGIEGGNYTISTVHGTEEDQYDILLTGPGREQVVKLVDEVVSKARSITAGSIHLLKNSIIEDGHIVDSPIKVSKDINIPLNISVSGVVAGMASVFLIFLIRYLSGKVYSKDDVERLLNTKVLSTIAINKNENRLAKFFKVR